jgi:hypothetical protein
MWSLAISREDHLVDEISVLAHEGIRTGGASLGSAKRLKIELWAIRPIYGSRH